MFIALLLSYSVKAQNCFPYVSRCQYCTNGLCNSANKCGTGLILAHDFQGCMPCDHRCQECTTTESASCTKCRVGFFYRQSQPQLICVPCSFSCKRCEFQTICLQCIKGYYLLEDACKECTLNNSLSCERNIILQCDIGYRIVGNGGSCQPCIPNCKQCQNGQQCTQCLEGYYYNGKCEECIANCKSCIGQNLCLQCISKQYYLQNNQCKSCKQGCSLCQSKQQCILCDNGYALNGNTCSRVSTTVANCKQYQDNNNLIQCKLCIDGYFLKENQCLLKCSLLCQSCYEPHYGHCNLCNQEFASLQNQMCIPYYIIQTRLYQEYFPARSWFNSYTAKKQRLFCYEDIVEDLNGILSLQLSSIKAYRVQVHYKIYIFKGNDFTIKMNGKDNKSHSISSQTQSCKTYITSTGSNSASQTKSYKVNVFKDNFTNLQVDNNTLTFEAQQFGISQVLIRVYQCQHQKCLKCTISQCLICQQGLYIQNQQCLTFCDLGFYLYQHQNIKQCLRTCPSNTYLQIKNDKCLICKNNCQTCVSQIQCITCKVGFYYLAQTKKCLQKCPQKFYNSSIFCSKCQSPCKTCENQLKCTSCVSLFLTGNSCSSTCNPGFYPNLTLMQCVQCQNCLQCKQKDVCTKCQNNYLYQNKCVQQCPDRFYSQIRDESRICSICEGTCYNCQRRNFCTSCNKNFLIKNQGKCQKQCPKGFFGNRTNLQCSNCLPQCSQCLSLRFCTQCKNSYYLFQSSCLTNCPIGFYIVSTICKACSSNCKDCSLTYNNCTQCSSGILRIQQNNGFCQTFLQCPQGQYSNLQTAKCQACPTRCQSCISYQKCQRCNTGVLTFIGKCQDKCTPMYFNQSGFCRKCQLPCLQCTSINKCLSCPNGLLYYQVLNSCSATCIQGSYQTNNQQLQFCKQCPLKCTKCSNENTCFGCKLLGTTAYFLTYQNKCVLQCPDKFYGNVQNNQCVQCNVPCLTCSSANLCETCAQGLVKYQGSCLFACPNISYKNQSQCVKCKSPCQTCLNQTFCYSCKQGNIFFQEGGQCLKICPLGYFPSVGFCKKCQFPCQSCTNSSRTCSSCLSGYLLQNRCVLNCLSGYVQNEQQSICQKCNQQCTQCQQKPSQCTYCIQGKYLTTQNKCLSQCDNFYYPNNQSRTCNLCIIPCNQCYSQSNCSSCKIGNLLQGKCINQCPENNYVVTYTNGSACEQCDKSCKQCVDQSDFCIDCQAGKYPINGVCTDNCPDGFFPDNISYLCIPCKGQCKDCYNQNDCKSCKSEYLHQKRCYSFCLPGFLQSNQELKCIKCLQPCATCTIEVTRCGSCLSVDQLLYNGKCQKNCPPGTYQDSFKKVCQGCISPCKQCNSSNVCTSCVFNHILYEQYCLNQRICPNNYYLSENGICYINCPNGLLKQPLSRKCLSFCYPDWYIENGSCVEECKPRYSPNAFMQCVIREQQQRLLFDSFFYISENVLTIEILFNHEVQYKNQPTNQSVEIVIGNASFIDGSRILSQRQRIPLVLQSNSQKSIKYQSIFNQSLIAANASIQFLNSSQLLRKKLDDSPLVIKKKIFPIPLYNYYTIQQRTVGQRLRQISFSITIVFLILLLLQIIKNNVSQLYFVYYFLQNFYLLSLLSILYPPNLGQFLRGFQMSHFFFFPQIFQKGIPQNYRQQSPIKLYLYHYDLNFVRNTGNGFFILLIFALIIVIVQILNITLGDKLEYSDIKFIFKRLKFRYRWHYTNDVLFLLVSILSFFAFVQMNNYDTESAVGIISIILSLCTLVGYLIWVIFIFQKLRRRIKKILNNHLYKSLLVFYRSMITINQFAVYYTLLFYIRKIIQSLIIAISIDTPLYVLPVLGLFSVLNIFSLVHYMPFILTIANYIRILAQCLLLLIYILISVLQFKKQELTSNAKYNIGWVSIIIGIILLILLGIFFAAKIIDPDFFDELKKKERLDRKLLYQKQVKDRGSQNSQNFQGDQSKQQDSQQNQEQYSQSFSAQQTYNNYKQQNQHYSLSDNDDQKIKQRVPKILIRCLKKPQAQDAGFDKQK